jgi:hypothetical protein
MKLISFLLGASAIFLCNAAGALEPNKVCANGAEGFRRLLMNDSMMVRNEMRALQSVIPKNLPFSEVANRIRVVGAAGLLSEVLDTKDASFFCESDRPGKCISKAETIEKLQSVVSILAFWPTLYDRFYTFEGIQALDYEPNLQRIICRVTYWFNIELIKRYLATRGATETADIGFLEQQQRLLRATGQNYSRKFAMQPDGRGDIAMTLLPQDP